MMNTYAFFCMRKGEVIDAIIQWMSFSLDERKKNPDFSMADCLGAVQVKASMKAAPIFYCFAGFGYEISCEQSRMY